ncbi:3-phenylpropionate/cinnamic acid dioxygenase subunit beta [Streptomyces sp. NPDC058457]|uniref:3-phenylpropionate/cinnamic acid dioxygenase subunit beta n=1 Tax=Streptomyces sp. NPDC058457 TaxID=3346507 RepID=UPI0036555547
MNSVVNELGKDTVEHTLDQVDPRAMALQWSIAQFLYREADLLDERRFDEWLTLLHDDVEYQVPIRRNVHSGDLARENTRAGRDAMWFDEDKRTLTMRVTQLNTGEHWAEEPVSRVSHLVTNIRPVLVAEDRVEVTSRFVVQRNRVDTESDLFVGRRLDTLVPAAGSWLVRKRVVLVDQSVLLAKNLTIFL